MSPATRKPTTEPAPPGPTAPEDPVPPGEDELAVDELAAADEAETAEPEGPPYYCPGCGRRWNFLTECRGLSEAQPHAPIEVVSTDELSEDADPADHTPAPGVE